METSNFKREEFVCPCGCGFDEVDPSLIEGLQQLRDKLEKPIHVSSGCRCPSHNRKVGGGTYSRHLLGQAADIMVVGMTGEELYQTASSIPLFRGFGVGGHYLHVDTREEASKWCYDGRGRVVPWITGVGA